MPISRLEYFRHILDETDYLIDKRQGLSKEQFLRDETLKRAFVRSIEIIGEASKKAPAELKNRYSKVNWKAIGGFLTVWSDHRGTEQAPSDQRNLGDA